MLYYRNSKPTFQFLQTPSFTKSVLKGRSVPRPSSFCHVPALSVNHTTQLLLLPQVLYMKQSHTTVRIHTCEYECHTVLPGWKYIFLITWHRVSLFNDTTIQRNASYYCITYSWWWWLWRWWWWSTTASYHSSSSSLFLLLKNERLPASQQFPGRYGYGMLQKHNVYSSVRHYRRTIRGQNYALSFSLIPSSCIHLHFFLYLLVYHLWPLYTQICTTTLLQNIQQPCRSSSE